VLERNQTVPTGDTELSHRNCVDAFTGGLVRRAEHPE